ncbi:MAG: hypothetical protein H7231_09970 [Rhodoferax sp.]|nr:hypothetical protein [Actinomycetota bacterium]
MPPAGIEPWLRELLRCPKCHAELRDTADDAGAPQLACTSSTCGLVYRVDDGIPVLLVDEAVAGPAQQA